MPPDAEEAELFELSLFMLEGTLQVRLAGDAFEITTGDALHIPRGAPFGVENTTGNPAGFVLSFSPPPDIDMANMKQRAIERGRVVLEPDEIADLLGPLEFPPPEGVTSQ